MNRPTILSTCIFLTIILVTSCAKTRNPVASCRRVPDVYVKERTAGGASVEIEIKFKSGLITTPPSFAVWAEYPDGSYESVYATCKASKGYEDNVDTEAEGLPVWNGVREIEGLAPGDEELDAITTATPMRTGFIIHWEPLPLTPADTLRLFLEVNLPFDYNDYYTQNMGTNGQPSLIYGASFTLSPDSLTITLPPRIIGRSDPKGRNALVYTDRSGITTAQAIIEGLAVRKLSK